MNIIDIIILLCCVPAIFRGLSKGFIAQMAALVALVLGAWMSFHFSNVVVEWLKPVMDVSPAVLQAIAFTIILLGVFFALTLAGKMLEGIVKIVMLGWLNKLLGVVFALLKVVLVIGLFILLSTPSPRRWRSTVRRQSASRFSTHRSRISPMSFSLYERIDIQ